MSFSHSTAAVRRRGRPAAQGPALSALSIVQAALREIESESGKGDFSMRSVAAALGVDPMALYHYFSSKQALADALLQHSFQELERLPKRWLRVRDRQKRLEALAQAYLRCAARVPQLTRRLAAGGQGAVHAQFQRLFDEALGYPVPLRSAQAVARDVIVDYLHGAALAGPRGSARAFRSGWPVLMDGVGAALALHAPLEALG